MLGKLNIISMISKDVKQQKPINQQFSSNKKKTHFAWDYKNICTILFFSFLEIPSTNIHFSRTRAEQVMHT